jgi:hypothetical protein
MFYYWRDNPKLLNNIKNENYQYKNINVNKYFRNENKKELAEKYFSEVNISLFEVYNFDRFQELYSKVKTKFNLL